MCTDHPPLGMICGGGVHCRNHCSFRDSLCCRFSVWSVRYIKRKRKRERKKKGGGGGGGGRGIKRPAAMCYRCMHSEDPTAEKYTVLGKFCTSSNSSRIVSLTLSLPCLPHRHSKNDQ